MPENDVLGNNLEAINRELDMLRQRYDLGEALGGVTEEGLKALGELGISAYTITLVRAAGMLGDITRTFDDPSQAMRTNDVIPTITRVVSSSMYLAEQSQIDPRIEIATTHLYLSSISVFDSENQLDPNLGITYHDEVLDPLIDSLSDAQRLIS